MGKAAGSFEELNVYQRARELTSAVYAATRRPAFAEDKGLVDQIRRACVSIMSNIAEGFERGSKAEFIQFLYIAKGSAGEVRAQLEIACDLKYLPGDEYERLRNLVRLVGGMLSNFIAHVERSDYAGPKLSRPQRQYAEAQQKRMASLRAAQEVSMHLSRESAPPPSSP